MKSIPQSEKGILNPKNKVEIFGFNLFPLQIAFGVFREKRLIEFSWGLYCFFRYHPKKIANYKIDLDSFYCFKFIGIHVNKNDIVCRSVSSNGISKVYAEYGLPGAYLIHVKAGSANIYDPYKDDPEIYHIHNIVNIENDNYLISTGDSNKYLDELIINADVCKIIKRHLNHFGGFTASIKIKNTIFFGTDFSYRPNYILDFNSGKKYFLPRQAWLEIIIDIQSAHPNSLTIITLRLNDNVGHKVVFCLLNNIYISAVKISIVEEVVYETI